MKTCCLWQNPDHSELHGNHQAYNPTEGAAFCLMNGSLSHTCRYRLDIYQIIYANLTCCALNKTHTLLRISKAVC